MPGAGEEMEADSNVERKPPSGPPPSQGPGGEWTSAVTFRQDRITLPSELPAKRQQAWEGEVYESRNPAREVRENIINLELLESQTPPLNCQK